MVLAFLPFSWAWLENELPNQTAIPKTPPRCSESFLKALPYRESGSMCSPRNNRPGGFMGGGWVLPRAKVSSNHPPPPQGKQSGGGGGRSILSFHLRGVGPSPASKKPGDQSSRAGDGICWNPHELQRSSRARFKAMKTSGSNPPAAASTPSRRFGS